jgi:hypothetical protein
MSGWVGWEAGGQKIVAQTKCDSTATKGEERGGVEDA